MTQLLAALAGALLAGGVVLTMAGILHRGSDISTQLSTPLWATVRRLAARHARRLVVATTAGLVAFALTGWPVALLAAPAAVLGLPILLGAPPNRDIELLEALDRWVRALGATIPTGRSITDAIRASHRRVPALLAEPIALAVRRLDERWTVRESLLALADDLASPDADAVLAALILAADRGGTGAGATLAALGDSIQDRLRALREVEIERAKPRVVVRQVTAISVGVLAIALLIGRDFFAPYGMPLGQAILAALLAAYVGSLVALRRLTTPRRRERILGRAA